MFLLALIIAIIPGANTSTKFQESRTSLAPTAARKQALYEPVIDHVPTQPAGPQTEHKPQPTLEVGTDIQTVWLSFYYCLRTVYVPGDDGGGYCTATRSETLVHPGTAACQEDWRGRSFTIVGEEPSRIYTCEDTGSLITGNRVDIWFYTNGEGWSWPLKGEGVVAWLD